MTTDEIIVMCIDYAQNHKTLLEKLKRIEAERDELIAMLRELHVLVEQLGKAHHREAVNASSIIAKYPKP